MSAGSPLTTPTHWGRVDAKSASVHDSEHDRGRQCAPVRKVLVSDPRADVSGPHPTHSFPQASRNALDRA